MPTLCLVATGTASDGADGELAILQEVLGNRAANDAGRAEHCDDFLARHVCVWLRSRNEAVVATSRSLRWGFYMLSKTA